MRSVRLGVGIAVALAVAGLFVWLQANLPDRSQRFVVDNGFEDAACTILFARGDSERFSVSQGQRYERTFRSPKAGFAVVRCDVAGKKLETPGHFRLIDGGLAEVTLKPWGEVEVRYEGVGRF